MQIIGICMIIGGVVIATNNPALGIPIFIIGANIAK